jgi:hypothetical protein
MDRPLLEWTSILQIYHVTQICVGSVYESVSSNTAEARVSLAALLSPVRMSYGFLQSNEGHSSTSLDSSGKAFLGNGPRPLI